MIHSPKISPWESSSEVKQWSQCFEQISWGPDEEIFWISTSIAVLCSRTRTCWCCSAACFAVFCVFRKKSNNLAGKLFVWPSGKLFKALWSLFYLARRLPWRDFWWMDHRSSSISTGCVSGDGTKYLQNCFVYLSSRHVAGFLVLSFVF